jgi:ribonucleoside-diphosphate reductase alpha chain
VRGTGGYIKGTNGESQGVIPFLKLHNDQLIAVNQGGKRRGSGCAYLEVWHNDIEDFLQLRVNTGDERRRTHDLNTANWIPDLFMKRMESRQNWTLFRSNETPDLHDLYGSAFEKRYIEYEGGPPSWRDLRPPHGSARSVEEDAQGHLRNRPSVDHLQRSLQRPQPAGPLRRHPQLESLHRDHAQHQLRGNRRLQPRLRPHRQPPRRQRRHRSLQAPRNHPRRRAHARQRHRHQLLPHRGRQDRQQPSPPHRSRRHGPRQYALYRKGLPFASKEAVEFNDEFMEAVAYYAYEASSDLAAEKGTYSTYKGSKWDRGLLPQDTVDLLAQERGLDIEVPRGGKMDWSGLRAKIAKNGMRNSNVLAIAPTATISNIMGSSPCIEPLFTNFYTKSNLSGDFMVLNPYLVKDLKKRGLWNSEIQNKIKYTDGELESIEEIPVDLKRKYATAFGIDWAWLLDAAARRQKWIDQSQSVNLFCGESAMQTLSHMYRAAWRKGLKTTYYLRTRSASNIEKATSEVEKEKRGIVGTHHAAVAVATAAAKQFTADEALACSLEAMRNGGTCEACQ